MKYRVYIGSSELDVDDVAYPIDLAVFDLDKPDTHKSNKSRMITVPATSNNQAILGRLQDVNVSRNISGVEGRIEYGNFALRGRVRFYDIENDDGHVVYNIQIISGNGDWVKQIENRMLTELDLTSIEHDYTEANIDNSEVSGDYLYPLVNYGVFEGTDGKEVIIEDRLPAVKLFAIIKQMFKAVGYKIVSNFITDASGSTFPRWFMSYGRNPDIYTQEDCDGRLFQAAVTQFEGEQTISPPAGSRNIVLWSPDNYATVAFDDDSDDPNFDAGGLFNTTTYKYKADQAGSYRFYAGLKLKLWFPSPIINVDPTFKVEIVKNGTDVLATATDDSYTWGAHDTYCESILKADTRYVTLAANDEITVRLTVTGTVDTSSGLDSEILLLEVVPGEDTYFRNKLLRRPAKGYVWTVEKMLPEVTQLAWLKAVAEVFNLQFCTNERERTVYIEQWESFYKGTVQNWTGRLDRSKKVVIEGKDIPTYINYRMRIDNNDSQIVNYNTEVRLSGGNGDTEDMENAVFADTLLDYCREIGLNTVKIPKLWKVKDEYPDIPEQFMAFAPRLFYYDGQTALPSGESWTFENTEKSTYPKVSIYNFEDFVAYRSGMHKLMNNSQSITAYFRLSESDMNHLSYSIAGRDFRSPVYLDDTFYRGRYLIKKITAWQPDRTAEVSLIQARQVAAGVTTRQVEIPSEGTTGGGGGTGGGGTTTGSCLVTDSAVITEITDESNWTNGNYTGSKDGLSECNYYIDWVRKIKYFFDGSHLVRFNINVVW